MYVTAWCTLLLFLFALWGLGALFGLTLMTPKLMVEIQITRMIISTVCAFVGKNQLVGDMLCLTGAVLFAIVTVLQELAIRHTDIVEYLGLLGLFGSIVSGIQM